MATERLAGVSATWCVVGGWSIDLFLGGQTRSHDDLEIATIRSDLATIRTALSPLVLHVVGDGEVRRLPPDDAPPLSRHQHWFLDEPADAWRLDVMVEPGDDETWVYRRDERIAAPRREMVGRTPEGVPYLRPHGSLLYKAKEPRPKDEADFEQARPHLSVVERTWLSAALDLLHPGHPWIARLQ